MISEENFNRIIKKTDIEYAKSCFPKRRGDGHKGDFGKVVIAAGSKGMSGSCALASMSALRTGSGLVKAAVPKDIIPVLSILTPETISIKRKEIFKTISDYDALGIGPGLTVCRKTIKLVRFVLENYSGNMVLDADALNAVSVSQVLQSLLRKASDRVIITPHLGEAARLLGKKSLKGIDRTLIADALSTSYGCTVVLKGRESLVCCGKEMYVNTTGNPGMATAGSGDVLTGIITSLLGQGMDTLQAARAGVFVHGLAGDFACEKRGEYGMTARDIAYMIPKSIKLITEV